MEFSEEEKAARAAYEANWEASIVCPSCAKARAVDRDPFARCAKHPDLPFPAHSYTGTQGE